MCYPTRIKVVASVVAGVSAYSLFEHWSFKSLVATISLAYALGFVGNERKTQVVKASTSSKAFTHVVKKASLESVGAEIYSSSEGFSSDDEIIGNEKKAEVVRKAEVVVSSNSFSSFQDNLKLSLEKSLKVDRRMSASLQSSCPKSWVHKASKVLFTLADPTVRLVSTLVDLLSLSILLKPQPQCPSSKR